MSVPYISQLDPVTGKGGDNCGPACLAMLLAYEGVIAPSYGAMLHIADIVRDGLDDGRGQTGSYTNWQQLIGYAQALGRDVRWIDAWPGIYRALDDGQPVILILSNWLLLPRQYPVNTDFNAHHFIVLDEYRPERGTFLVNDPLSVYVRGPVEYTAASIVAAVADYGAVQAMCLEPTWNDLPILVETPQGVLDVLNMTDEELTPIARQLWGRVPFNADNAIPKAYLADLRAGKYRGAPVGGEVAVADGRVLQRFKRGSASIIAVYVDGKGAGFAE